MNINYRIGKAIIFLLVVFTIQSCNSCFKPECNKGTLIEVQAKPADWSVDVLSETPIDVKKGDTILFSASGEWTVGLGYVGPNGKEDWIECGKVDCVEYPVRQRSIIKKGDKCFRGYVGALVGRIGLKGEPFLIGYRNTITAGESGKLFLGSNDNLCPCYGQIRKRGSCYDDNHGKIRVCVEIR
jgi:hypothetical protein